MEFLVILYILKLTSVARPCSSLKMFVNTNIAKALLNMLSMSMRASLILLFSFGIKTNTSCKLYMTVNFRKL